MAYQALYRSYRPNIFGEVVGQENIIKTIRNAIKNGKTSHAYIFSGPRGIGKTTIARIFAKAINCDTPNDGEPCNKCEKCLAITKEQTTDIIELDAASNNGVEEMRNLLERVNFLPSFLNYKVYIIDEVHMLSISAFNALLKTLEEPPKHVVFLMATTEPHKIPLTIHSRCQRFDFKPLTIKQIASMLNKVAKNEEIKIQEEAINGIAEAAEGGMRDALGMLDQVSAYTSDEITLAHVDSVTGRISNYQLINLVSSFNDKDIVKSLKIVEDLIESGKEITRIVVGLIQTCRDLLLFQTVGTQNINKLIFENDDFKHLAESTTKSHILKYIDILIDIQNKIKLTTSPKIYLEVGIMKIASIDNISSLNGIENEVAINFEEKFDLINLKIKKLNDDFINFQSTTNYDSSITQEFKNKFDSLEAEKNLLKLEVEEKFEIVNIVQDILQEMQAEINQLKLTSNELVFNESKDETKQTINIDEIKQQILSELNHLPNNDPVFNNQENTNESINLKRLQKIEENYNSLIFKINEMESIKPQINIIDNEEFYELKDHYLLMFERVNALSEQLNETLKYQGDQAFKMEFENISNVVKTLEQNNHNQLDQITSLKEKNELLIKTIEQLTKSLTQNTQTVSELLENINNVKEYSFKLGARLQQLEDNQKNESIVSYSKEEKANVVKPKEEKTVVVRTKPVEKESIQIEETIDETSSIYDVKRIEIILHESREPKARDEKVKIMNSWKKLNERVSVYLAPVAQYLMEGMFVANGLKDMIIVYPSAQLCNYLMEEKVHNEAKQVLKNALGKDMDFIALPENVWQEKRKEYHGQYYMGIKYPTLTPINNPELRIIKTTKENITINKSNSEKKAEELFGPKLIKREG